MNKKNNYVIIISLIIISLILVYYLLNNYYEHYEDEFKDADEIKIKMKEIVEEPSGKCETNGDLVNFCVNYKSCCGSESKLNDCICKHPVVKNCRTQFKTCIDNPEHIKIYGEKALMEKCFNENKSCCIPYNSISITRDKFKTPINNNPQINKLCSIQSIPNIEEKCMELCQTHPDCKAFSIEQGELIQTNGTCNLYNDISLSQLKTDPFTGKTKQSTNANYYIKK